jgi:uncharacterized protein YjiK
MRTIITILFFSIFVFGCNSQSVSTDKQESAGNSKAANTASATFPYDLNHPSTTYTLPEILNEVSGVTFIDSTRLACIQDELGTAFIYNLASNSVEYEHKFDQEGDFEGVTFTTKALYILRSDGRLTEWGNFNVHTGGKEIQHITPLLQTTNNEGLCYDSLGNRLLIAGKNKPANNKSERYIYEYNLAKKEFGTEPAYRINLNAVEQTAVQLNLDLPKEYSAKGKEKAFNFRPSDLAVHPVTGEIYVLSASDKLLLVLDRKGNIQHLAKLAPELFPKAEGIAFSPNGTMLISNEAKGKRPTILIFKPSKDSQK